MDSRTGNDNVVGATRTSPFLDGTAVERLEGYQKTANSLELSWHLVQPLTFTGALPHFPTERITLESYTEIFRVHSICEGTSTYLEFIAIFCVDNPESMFDIWGRARTIAVDQLSQQLDARAFRGTCRVSYHVFFSKPTCLRRMKCIRTKQI